MTLNDLVPSGSVVVAEVDVVDFGVGEVDPLIGQIERQSVGPVDLTGEDRSPIGAVHVDSLDARMVAPIRPEQHLKA